VTALGRWLLLRVIVLPDFVIPLHGAASLIRSLHQFVAWMRFLGYDIRFLIINQTLPLVLSALSMLFQAICPRRSSSALRRSRRRKFDNVSSIGQLVTDRGFALLLTLFLAVVLGLFFRRCHESRLLLLLFPHESLLLLQDDVLLLLLFGHVLVADRLQGLFGRSDRSLQ